MILFIFFKYHNTVQTQKQNIITQKRSNAQNKNKNLIIQNRMTDFNDAVTMCMEVSDVYKLNLKQFGSKTLKSHSSFSSLPGKTHLLSHKTSS